MEKGRLNLDVAESISALRAVMKKLELKIKLYKMIIRGKGLEFDGYRTYGPDDDASDIDWKASKRGDRLLVRKYIEERDLKIVFLIDTGENMVFGSTPKLKCEYAAEASLALADLIMSTGNNSGFLLFSDKVKEYVTPGRGKRHFNSLIDYVSNSSNYGGPSKLDVALDFALNYFTKSIASVIIVSDFSSANPSIETKLSQLAYRFETMVLLVKDPLDKTLPEIHGEFVLEDPATGQRILLNPKIAKKQYEKFVIEHHKKVIGMFERNGIDYVELDTDQPFVPVLTEFLRERMHR
jgi:uncharacterized protein (DUF58 family)